MWLVAVVSSSLANPSTAVSTVSATYHPGVVLVRWRADAVPHAVLPRSVQRVEPIAPGLSTLAVAPGSEQQTIAALEASPAVAYAQLDHRVTAQVSPDDPRYAEQWNMTQIGMPAAWDIITDTSTITVAVLDTGITLDHPDLRDQIWRNPGEIANNGLDDDHNGFADDVNGWHFFHTYRNGTAYEAEDNDVRDANGHGSHIAGIIGATGNNGIGVSGVAWRARIIPVRVLEDDAVGWESDVIRGVRYAMLNHARIIQMSLGQAEQTPALADAMAEAEARGVLVVAAAGNTGGRVLYPAAFPSVLSVGASGPDGQRAAFSAWGPRLDLLAPGTNITSTWNGLPYFTRSGTSMAAPHVAGAAALLLARNPGMMPFHIRQCLLRAAMDVGSPGRDDASGWGVLQVARPLQGCAQLSFLPLLAQP